MNRTPPLLAVVAVALLSAGGCGTVANLSTDDPKIYGGVRDDVSFLSKLTRGSGGTSERGEGAIVVGGIWLGEFAATAACDTVTVPVVLYLKAARTPDRRPCSCLIAPVSDDGVLPAVPAAPIPAKPPEGLLPPPAPPGSATGEGWNLIAGSDRGRITEEGLPLPRPTEELLPEPERALEQARKELREMLRRHPELARPELLAETDDMRLKPPKPFLPY